ncbi:phosphatidylglycerophosphatase A [Candidatus Aalborgicola defluviihabitans]|jgi:phosphatidylglycerophosphatase A|uniref:phosphatidylglycerophosphatase A family protein n=1 Tax=Candidatus Aalborgicola defluviihabitans TaxID=3386187 RepID=UPI001E16A4A0|nr:phosphatidylglycerophosphatase A [Burkholderiales bacterium]MBK7281544.1 phosphatidylglycerophosphatase A [Burkholderiales bacterium]MBK7315483.1 phosphatidylglycerophosphatase A [Burkholderiales bacterium]MBL0242922.1 phosphatidylglycerophosphatase A [Rhodoferax sp.]
MNESRSDPTLGPVSIYPEDPGQSAPMARPTVRFMLSNPAHWLALGFGSGLSRIAPGTAGTLWAWIAFIALSPWMTDARWAVLIAVSLPVGWWACSITARNMGVLDPGSVVWDEVVAFWLVLWLVMPTGLVGQVLAFGLFRFFDAVKPGPVGWADSLYHALDPASDPTAWRKAGFGIMLDDLVAAGCTVLVVAAWRFFE